MASARGACRTAIGQQVAEAAGDQEQLLLAPPRFPITLSAKAGPGTRLLRQEGRPLVVEAQQQCPLAAAVAATHRAQQRER